MHLLSGTQCTYVLCPVSPVLAPMTTRLRWSSIRSLWCSKRLHYPSLKFLKAPRHWCLTPQLLPRCFLLQNRLMLIPVPELASAKPESTSLVASVLDTVSTPSSLVYTQLSSLTSYLMWSHLSSPTPCLVHILPSQLMLGNRPDISPRLPEPCLPPISSVPRYLGTSPILSTSALKLGLHDHNKKIISGYFVWQH